MNTTKNLKNRKDAGFTLIEILVVIGIIAVLAAVVLVAVNPARQFALARNSQRESNVTAILNAIGQYIADNKGDLPSDVEGASDLEVNEDLCNDLVPDYLPAIPTDPDSATDGADIDDCTDVDAGDVDYEVTQDADTDRITVCAPNAADESAIDDAEEICVTR